MTFAFFSKRPFALPARTCPGRELNAIGGSVLTAEDIVMCTGAAAFSRAPDGTITAWNKAAELLMMVPAKLAVGRRCHEIIKGRDVFDNDFCCESCTCWRMAVADQRIHPFRLVVSNPGDRRIELKVSILAASGSIGPKLVHLIELVAENSDAAVLPGELAAGSSAIEYARAGLTRRELEVLRHLAQGYSTAKTARRMKISTTTVRNHISRCLQKLDAHSRIEAVAKGRLLDLV